MFVCRFIIGLLDHVTVLIGIAYGGTAIAGVINQPFYNYQVQPVVRVTRYATFGRGYGWLTCFVFLLSVHSDRGWCFFGQNIMGSFGFGRVWVSTPGSPRW